MGCRQSKVVAENEKAKPVLVSYEDRKCRDVFWLILFIAYWVGMGMVAILAFQNGDAARLLYGVDSHGNQCGGVDSKCVGNKKCGKFITYPKVDEDFARAAQNGIDLTDPTAVLSIPFTGICVSECPEGPQDTNGDGKVHDWVCDYDAMETLNANFDSTNEGSDIPSTTQRALLEGCLDLKRGIPGLFAAAFLGNYETIGSTTGVPCKDLMSSCYKMYSPERSLYFRCIPQTETNATCTESPYLDSIGESVETKTDSNENTIARPATDPYCGTCLDPISDDNGDPMDPSSDLCKAKRVVSTSSILETNPNPVFEKINTWTAVFTRWMGDVKLAQVPIIVSGAGVAIVTGIIWLILMRFFAGIFVWVTLWGLLAAFAFLTIQFLMQGQVINTDSITGLFGSITSSNSTDSDVGSAVESLQVFSDVNESQQRMYEILGYCMLGVTVIYLLIILTMRRRIRLAIGVLKEATKVVAAMPFIMLFPLNTVAASLAVAGYTVYISMLIVSSGEITAQNVTGFTTIAGNSSARLLLDSNSSAVLADVIVSEFESSSLNTWLFVYNFFGFLWTNQLIAAIGATTIAGASASHYWASEFEKEKVKKMPRRPVLASLRKVFRFHLGSLAFGAFIIAVVQLIRAFLAYLDKQTRTLQRKNKLIMVLMKAVQCCLWCFEKVLKFITKNAYILIALKGSSFCTATRDGFLILLNNFAKIGIATAINNLMLLLAKLVITAAAGVVCWLHITNLLAGEEAPSTAFVPVVVSVILAWYVGAAFMSVYALTVDTIMICFCEDEKHNDGSPNKPYYMPESLRRIARKSNKLHDRMQAVKKTTHDEDDDDVKAANAPSAPPKSRSEAPML